jgi:competence protein ComEC
MLHVACLVIVGAALGLLTPTAPNSIVYPYTFLGLGALGWCAGGIRTVLLVLVYAMVSLQVFQTVDDTLPATLSRQDIIVEGIVSDFPRSRNSVTRFQFAVRDDPLQPGVPSKLYLSWYDSVESLVAGERWKLMVRLKRPHGLMNPGGFVFEKWLFRHRIGATGYVRAASSNARDASVAPENRLLAMRAALVKRIENALAGAQGAPFVVGLTVGARHGLTNADWELLRRTGTAHLMAISGLHIGLAAGLLMLLGRCVAKLMLYVGIPASPQRWGIVAGLVGAFGYAALAGFAIPALRACCMFAALATLSWRHRHWKGTDILAVAAIAVISIDPFGLLSAGFWMSFTAVAILFATAAQYRPAQPRLEEPESRRLPLAGLLRGLARAFGTQLAMVIGLAPLSVALFGEFAWIAPLVNLLAIPAFAIAIMPGILTGIVLLLLMPSIGEPLLVIMAGVLQLFLQFLQAFAYSDHAVWSTGSLDPISATLGVVGAAILVAPPPVPARWLAGLLVLPALTGYQTTTVPPSLRVTVFDVGHGLSALIQTERHSLLYDTGPAYRNGDAASTAVLPALRALGVDHLDAVVISHADSDHSGGAQSVLAAFPAAELIAYKATTLSGYDYRECRAGMNWVWDAVTFEVLHPDRSSAWSDNNRSCVILVKGPQGSVLLPGDIERPVEESLTQRHLVPPVDLVIAPHHGSRSSSANAFVRATQPRFVVFSSGYENRWGLPDPAIQKRWESGGACLLTTAADGALVFESGSGGSMQLVRAQRRGAGRPWIDQPNNTRQCAVLTATR